MRQAVVIGTGLIGTSLGLALRADGWDVYLEDRDAVALSQASDLGAGSVGAVDPATVDLVAVCVPPSVVTETVLDALARFPRAVVTDVASIKAQLMDTVHATSDSARFVGGHPLAGREVSGPAGARSDLFEGRAWVLTPNGSAPEAIALVAEVVGAVGATATVMSATEHDSAVALVSHVPQVMASLMAARLVGSDDVSVGIAGQGLRDVTRIAASDPAMWSEIIDGNAADVRSLLVQVRDDLDGLIAGIDGPDRRTTIAELVSRGNAGYARIPGKHGERPQRYTDVPVVIPDSPGALASLFELAGATDVNVEDLSLEHSPGQPVGLATLRVLPERAEILIEALIDAGWTVHR